MKTSIRITIVLLATVLFSYFTIPCSQEFYSVIYTVLGIMFSIALSQLMSFSFTEVANPKYVDTQRKQLRSIRRRFIIQFTGGTLFFLLSSLKLHFQKGWFRFDFQSLVFVYMIYCLFYFIVNFIELSNLKDSLEDEIRKSRLSNT